MASTFAPTRDLASVEFALPDAATTARAALTDALGYCAARMSLAGPEVARDLLRQGDRDARGYFEYGLAQKIAQHLGALDEEVQAAYLYDAEANDEDAVFGNASPTLIHMLVWAQRKTGALNSLLSALNRALAENYGALMGMPDIAHLVDVQVVDAAEVAAGKGYAGMLNWLHHRPLLVWKR